MSETVEQAERAERRPVTPLPWASLAALVLANLVPLWGVVFNGWTVFSVVLLFCLENLVIAGYTVLRMACVTGPAKAAQIILFMVIYGMFTLFHLLFVFVLFGRDMLAGRSGEMPWDYFAAMAGAIYGLMNPFSPGEIKLWASMLGLVLSHGVSFRVNFIGRREHERVSIESLVFRPFGRVAVLHVTVIVGAGIVTLTGAHVSALVLLVLLKIGVDARGHWKERVGLAKSGRALSAGEIARKP